MNTSTIRHIKSQAKRLKKNKGNASYCQCLDLVSQQLYGVRSFHDLRRALETQLYGSIEADSFPNEFRANDWPYFEIPVPR